MFVEFTNQWLIHHNTFDNWFSAVLWFLGVVVIFKLIETYVVGWLKKLSKQSFSLLDDVLIEILENIGLPLYTAIGILVGSQFLLLSDFSRLLVQTLSGIVIFFYLVKDVQRIAKYGLDRLMRDTNSRQGFDDPMMKRIIAWAINIVLWCLGLIVLLQNLGIEVGALIGGLGIGGIAIAFALQNVLTDLFSYFSIYFDKPFQVGDFIISGKEMGTVERIGLKSTRIRTLQGEELVVSNQDLTSARVQNFKDISKRRVVFNFGIEYSTPLAKVKKIPDWIKKILEKTDQVEMDRVHFKAFGDSALLFECVYYVSNGDYTLFMDIQQQINFSIMELLEKNSINFAYPSQTIYIKK